jgi:hypothetical protein
MLKLSTCRKPTSRPKDADDLLDTGPHALIALDVPCGRASCDVAAGHRGCARYRERLSSIKSTSRELTLGTAPFSFCYCFPHSSLESQL